LSKRHGALGVEAYREMGYLPAALRNYLARLGWSHGDQEFFSTEEMIDGLRSRQRHRSRRASISPSWKHERPLHARGLAPFTYRTVPIFRTNLNDQTRAQLLAAMPGLKERAKTLLELAAGAGLIFSPPPAGAGRQGCSAATPEVQRGHHGKPAGVLPTSVALDAADDRSRYARLCRIDG
jgi:glutamyl-tRNA synthetase